MTAMITTIYEYFQGSKTQGSYFLLFAIGVFALYRINSKRNRYFMLYLGIILLLFVVNPVTLWALSLVIPSVASYEPMLALIPILIVIPFTASEIILSLKTRKQRHIVGIILFLLVAVCGNMFGLFKGDTMTSEYCYDSEKQEIVEYMDEFSPKLVLASEEIIPFISNYMDSAPLLYGYDLWESNLDTGIMDSYDDGLYTLFDLMRDPESNIDSIVSMGTAYGCDIIIVDRFEGAKAFEGEYVLKKQTENYLIYAVRNS